ncbi:unnamed protein product [Penicillium manginii]
MPPKKDFRKSLPARITPPAKSIDLTTASPPHEVPDDPYLCISYTPSSTATMNGKLQNSPSETPAKRRQAFQAKPSRLSNVYTPAKEAQPSILNSASRTTRRTAGLETPKKQMTDQEFPESINTTGWVQDQHTGNEFGYDNSISDASPTSASSATRLSARSRKLTTRAIEALDSKKKPRKQRTAPASTFAEPPTEQVDINSGPTKIKRKGMKGKRASRIFKQLRNNRPSRLKIQLHADQAGQKLYELVVVALNTDFTLPSDPELFIANARKQFEQTSLVKSSEEEPVMSAAASPSDRDPAAAEATASSGNAGISSVETHVDPNGVTKNQTNGVMQDERDKFPLGVTNGKTRGEPNGEPIPEVSGTSSIKDLKKIAESQLEADGWTRTGYVNDLNEEILLTPPGQTAYRAPHTYGDENLPLPPVISRPEQQIEIDNNLGFPPLMGDRNIPFYAPSEFSTEDITEEKARSQAHKRKRSQAELEKRPRKKKRDSAKITQPGPTTEEKPKIQRLKLKLNPPTEADRQAGAVISSTSAASPTQRGAPGQARSRGRGGPGTPRARGSPRGVTRGRGTPRGAVRGALRGTQRGGSARGGSSRPSTPRSRGRGRGRGK